MTSTSATPYTEPKNPFFKGIPVTTGALGAVSLILWLVSVGEGESDALQSAVHLQWAGTWFGWAILALLTALAVGGVTWKLGAIEYRAHLNRPGNENPAGPVVGGEVFGEPGIQTD